MVIKREQSNWFNSGKYANCYGWAKRDKIERAKEKKMAHGWNEKKENRCFFISSHHLKRTTQSIKTMRFSSLMIIYIFFPDTFFFSLFTMKMAAIWLSFVVYSTTIPIARHFYRRRCCCCLFCFCFIYILIRLNRSFPIARWICFLKKHICRLDEIAFWIRCLIKFALILAMLIFFVCFIPCDIT